MQLGLSSILTIIFVIAKLTHNIDWSWWLVFSPTLASVALTTVVIFIAALAQSSR